MRSATGRSRLRPLVPAGLVLIALIGCAPSREAVLHDRGFRLPGFSPGPVSELSIDQVAADALDPEELMTLLEANGFTGATAQAHSAGVGGSVRTVRIEVVAFDAAAGADAYLTWLREHADELVGQVEDESIRDLPVAFVFSHEPSGCCSKEQPVWVTAWRSGTDAVWVRVIGPDVRPGRIAGLVEQLQAPR